MKEMHIPDICPQYIPCEQLVTPEQVRDIPKAFFVGYFASGKSEAARLLASNHGFAHYTYSEHIGIYADKILGVDPSDRAQYLDIGHGMSRHWGTYFHSEWMTKRLTNDLSTNPTIRGVAIDGTRGRADIDYFRKLGNTTVIWIEADEADRKQWFLERSRSIDKNTVYEERDAAEKELIEPLRSLADIEIRNDGSKNDLYISIHTHLRQQFPHLFS